MIKYSAFIPTILFLFSNCLADTFIHHQTGESFNGYVVQKKRGNKTQVRTQGGKPRYIDLRDYNISYNRRGRKNQVYIVSIKDSISFEFEAKTFEQAITNVANQGPLFIIIEIDTPGGRLDLAKRFCAAITKTDNCRTIAFVNGNEFGGAISGGAAVALACDEVYMAGNTIIGAATLIPIEPDDSNIRRRQEREDEEEKYRRNRRRRQKSEDEEEKYRRRSQKNEDKEEKYSSAWRAYLASLAENSGRPGLLARAMVDKDIEVIEVSDEGKKLFIEPLNKKPEQLLVHTWSKKDSLLTLTAAEATQCGIADKVVNSQHELLNNLGAGKAKILTSNEMQKAKKEFERVKLKFERLRESLDLRLKQFQNTQSRGRARSLLRHIIKDFNTLIMLAKEHPDLHIDIHSLEKARNSAKARRESL